MKEKMKIAPGIALSAALAIGAWGEKGLAKSAVPGSLLKGLSSEKVQPDGAESH